MFVCREEARTQPPIKAHNIIILVLPSHAPIEKVGLNGREKDGISMTAIVLSMPLESHSIPMLPNPVRPDFVTGQSDQELLPPIVDAMNVADSYGLNGEVLTNFRERGTVSIYKSIDTGLYAQTVELCKEYQLQGFSQDRPPNTFLLLNGLWARNIKSSSVRGYLTEPATRYYALGPDLQLPISHWRLREIWTGGGLVMLSPTFVLRSPDKVAAIMANIQETPGWAAYVHPSTIMWCEESWNNTVRCPDRNKAYTTLTSALFDGELGELRACAGGLAVSSAPPQLQMRNDCARWLEWLTKVTQCDEWKELVGLCKQVVAGKGGSAASGCRSPAAGKDTSGEPLSLHIIEEQGLRDMARMRLRPHIVPYRRYIYIGELSLNVDRRNRAQEKGVSFVDLFLRLTIQIELVSADDFVAILAGVSYDGTRSC